MDGGASVVWALVRNPGTCRPDGTAGQWSGSGLRLVVWSENPKQQICEGIVVMRGTGADLTVVGGCPVRRRSSTTNRATSGLNSHRHTDGNGVSQPHYLFSGSS
jgi:hypothetical protein